MSIKELKLQDQANFDTLALHPLQSWAWGDFRSLTGVDVLRLGQYERNKLIKTFQITFHKIPHTPFTIAYIPKSDLPDQELLDYLRQTAKDRHTIFYKFEPNIGQPAEDKELKTLKSARQQLTDLGLVEGKSLFTHYSFVLDLDKSEEELLKLSKSKTRYNTRLAKRKGVTVLQDDSDQAFEDYLKLTFDETTVRQGFYAHNRDYHRKMWQTMHDAGIAHLFRASFEGEALVTWIVFVFNNILYYPYGASSSSHRNLMASNLMMWEVIKFGKKMKCKKFDMWGSLGPDPDPSDSWIGFHKFKQGYGPTLTEFVGTYDFVVNPSLYKIYQLADKVRWGLLALKKKFSK